MLKVVWSEGEGKGEGRQPQEMPLEGNGVKYANNAKGGKRRNLLAYSKDTSMTKKVETGQNRQPGR